MTALQAYPWCSFQDDISCNTGTVTLPSCNITEEKKKQLAEERLALADAAKAIVQLLLLLPLYERTVIMSMLEAISCHELVAHGRNVRLRHLGRRQSGYAMLLHSFRYFVNATDQDSDTDQDTDTAAETAAAEALSASAEIVLKSMPALRNNVSLIQQLHGAVDTRVETAFRPMGDVNPVNDLHEVSELSSVPSDDVVNHRDNDVVNHRENDVVNHRDNDHDINTV